MTLTRFTLCLVAPWVALGAQPVVAQDVDNPRYAPLAALKPGTTLVYSGNSKTMGLDTTVETTLRVQRVSEQSVLLEVTRKVTTQGATVDEPAMKQEITARLPATEKITLVGDDNDVYLKGKNYRCKIYEQISRSGDMAMSIRTFMSDEMPGGVVKIESRTEGPVAMNTTIELKEVKQPG